MFCVVRSFIFFPTAAETSAFSAILFKIRDVTLPVIARIPAGATLDIDTFCLNALLFTWSFFLLFLVDSGSLWDLTWCR